MVQGAWGIVPVHLNELSPPAIRATFPGFVYQLGNLIASMNAPLQTTIAEHRGSATHPDFAFALTLVCGVVAVCLVVLALPVPSVAMCASTANEVVSGTRSLSNARFDPRSRLQAHRSRCRWHRRSHSLIDVPDQSRGGRSGRLEYSFVQGPFTVPAAAGDVAELGYTEPTPIQQRAIPLVLEGRDLLAAAQTGTGKTAAFALPLLERLQNSTQRQREPRVLVLVPTRELAAQVSDAFRALARHLPMRGALIFGGVSPKPQLQALASGVDLVIATPGPSARSYAGTGDRSVADRDRWCSMRPTGCSTWASSRPCGA